MSSPAQEPVFWMSAASRFSGIHASEDADSELTQSASCLRKDAWASWLPLTEAQKPDRNSYRLRSRLWQRDDCRATAY